MSKASERGEAFEKLERSLTNQSPNVDQINRIEYLRERAKILGSVIINDCPTSRERSLALTHLEETVMWAVKAIVLEERVEEPYNEDAHFESWEGRED